MVLLKTRLYRLLYFSLSSSAVSCSRDGSSQGEFPLFFTVLNLSDWPNHFPQCFLVLQQFGCFVSNLFPTGIRFRVYVSAIRLRLSPDLSSLFFCPFLQGTADCILLAAFPLSAQSAFPAARSGSNAATLYPSSSALKSVPHDTKSKKGQRVFFACPKSLLRSTEVIRRTRAEFQLHECGIQRNT